MISPRTKRIRVLVAEDSPTARLMLVEMLRSSSDFEVVGEAENGADAIERAIALSPDLIVMDVHMPIMDGLDATKEIMREAPTPILMVSATASPSDVALALSATQAGALMILEKPSPGSADWPSESKHFLAMAKAMAAVKVVRRWSLSGARPLTPSPPAVRINPTGTTRLIAIGTSTGGPAALHRILIDLPRDFTIPIVVVQHMARGFIDGLAKWLGANVAIKVTTASQGEVLQPGTVYIAPDDRHLGVSTERRAVLSDSSPLNGFRPAADHLFDSCGRSFGPALTAVVLTGMGQDGVQGLRTVRTRGGYVIGQDEQSSIVFGMAQVAMQNGLVHEMLPLDSIGRRLNEIAEAAAP